MKSSPWLLPALGTGVAVATLPISFLILRFASHPVEITAVVLTILLVALAVLGYLATRRGQAAAFVAIALVLPYALFATVSWASLERASSEIGSIFEDAEIDFDIDDSDFGDDLEPDSSDSDLPPESYGDDPELDRLQDSCLGGDEDACNELFFDAPSGSQYESIAEEALGL